MQFFDSRTKYSKLGSETTTAWLSLSCYVCVNIFLWLYYIKMYQLGSLSIFGQKLISVYIRGFIKNILLYFQKYKWGCFFPASKVFTSTKSYWFWYKGFINNSVGVTWKFCPRSFKNSEIDCTVSQKKNQKKNSELQKFKKGNVATIWLCKKLWLRRPETFENEWQKLEHFLRILFNVACVVDRKLVLRGWFFYN